VYAGGKSAGNFVVGYQFLKRPAVVEN